MNRDGWDRVKPTLGKGGRRAAVRSLPPRDPNNNREASFCFWTPRRAAWLLELESCRDDTRRDWLHSQIAKADEWLENKYTGT